MEVTNVDTKDIDLKKELEEKINALEIETNENFNLRERITDLEEAVRSRDTVIYNLAVKLSQL